MVDTSPGFRYEGRYGGGYLPDIIIELAFKDTETLTKGDLLNIESGELDLAVAGDTSLAGAAIQTKVGVDSTTLMEVHVAPDAVYSVYDPNARSYGDTLDITGATGAMTVTSTSNADVKVVGGLAADERTLVVINHGSHVHN